ncbi:hypothetical protein BD410DRAFT_377099 [Rickenella mellea]|uniref:RING-type domain-containing protein n=1 Tax=Rickenella mellea TaxID=50990 RepID=A0A4Y7PYT9_9AGAM|nr:hypothetical protein BD410DRAFT_377099 [Rickenella mellea]
MLVVHPSSTCDVCLEPYSWDAIATTPHSIACGHVFCNQCLRNLNPRNCPLCRRPFVIERIRKLHVDVSTDHHALLQSSTDLEVRQLAESIAAVSTDSADDEARQEVIQRVSTWLESHPLDTHRVLRESVSLLQRYVALKAAVVTLREERDAFKYKWKTSEQRRKQDKNEAKAQEDSLKSSIAETSRTYNQQVNSSHNCNLRSYGIFRIFTVRCGNS